MYVGRYKVYLDETDMSLNVAQVTSTFGSFIKYTVRTVQNSTSPTIQVPRLNAFELVFQSQQRLTMQTLPSRIQLKKFKTKAQE